MCAVYAVNTGSVQALPFSCDQYLVTSYYGEIVKPDLVFE